MTGVRFGVAGVALLGLVTFAPAQPTGLDPKKRDALVEQFRDGQRRADEALLKTFDDAARAAGRAPGLAPDVRLSRQNKIKDQKAAFEKDRALPSFDDLMPAAWDDMDAVHRARAPLARAYDRELARLAKAGQTEAGQALARERAELDARLLRGRNAFRANTNWSGYRIGAANNISFSFHVGAFDGSAVKGRVTQSDGTASGTVELVVEGRLNGNRAELKTVKTVRGKPRQLVFVGYVVENRLFLQVGGTTPNGRPASGLVVLTLAK